MHPIYMDEGSFLKSILSVSPQSTGSATVTGSGVATLNGPGFHYDSCQLIVFTGAIAGSPGTISVAGQLQDSPDGTTAWANYGAAMPVLAGAAGAANTLVLQNQQIRGSRGFLRLVLTVTLVTYTAVLVGGVIILGGASEDPAI